MPSQRFVIQESLNGPAELRARVRGMGTRKGLMLRHRPQIRQGDQVQVHLSLSAPALSMVLSGVVDRARTTCAASTGPMSAFQVALDSKSAKRLEPALFDSRLHSTIPERRALRMRIGAWGDCQLPQREGRRAAQIVDVSKNGAFLATALEVDPGSTVIFKPAHSRSWFAGAVRWRGKKASEIGLGIEVVFSRAEERIAWHQLCLEPTL